jgi:hypothetical protein
MVFAEFHLELVKSMKPDFNTSADPATEKQPTQSEPNPNPRKESDDPWLELWKIHGGDPNKPFRPWFK